MKVETQASRLERMMRKHRNVETYRVTLPPVALKRKDVKMLEPGDVLLLELEHLELLLVQKDEAKAYLELSSGQGKCIVLPPKEEKKETHTKKYELLYPSFGRVDIAQLTEDTVLDLPKIDLSRVALQKADETTIAEGVLVESEGMIALEIKKVYR